MGTSRVCSRPSARSLAGSLAVEGAASALATSSAQGERLAESGLHGSALSGAGGVLVGRVLLPEAVHPALRVNQPLLAREVGVTLGEQISTCTLVLVERVSNWFPQAHCTVTL